MSRTPRDMGHPFVCRGNVVTIGGSADPGHPPAGKALSYLAQARVGVASVPADHWALIATAALMPYAEQVRSVVQRDQLLGHTIQICNSILRDQFRGGAAAGLDGAFDPGGRTAPAATRLEGLLAALEFLQKDSLRHSVEAAVERGIAFLLRAQVASGDFAGGMTGSVRTSAVDSSEVRVDYVQHALCAWLHYRQLLTHINALDVQCGVAEQPRLCRAGSATLPRSGVVAESGTNGPPLIASSH